MTDHDDNVSGRPAPSDSPAGAAAAQPAPAAHVPEIPKADPMLLSVISRLADRSYEVSASSGFHDHDNLFDAMPDESEGQAGWDRFEREWDRLQDASRLMLMVTELGEALEALRDGDPWLIYFVLKTDADPSTVHGLVRDSGLITMGDRVPLDVGRRLLLDDPDRWAPVLKPDGPVVELADTIIRVADLAGARGVGDELGLAISLKETYNRHRGAGKKHGRQF